MADQSMQTLTTDIEKELINEIIRNLDQATISPEQAQGLAREFLSLLPLQDKKDLLDKLYTLSNKYPETKKIYLEYSKPIEEEERQKKLTLMSQHIKNGKIDEALAVAKADSSTGTKP